MKKEVSEKEQSKVKKILVLAFSIIFSLVVAIYLRGTYLEYLELGKEYVSVFKVNLFYEIGTFFVFFIISYALIRMANNSVKKGVKLFFDEEKKQMPKFPNKSISFILSCIISFGISILINTKLMQFLNASSFGQTDMIFHLDFSYYIFRRPLIEFLITLSIIATIAILIYKVIYYIVIFHKYFDGIDINLFKKCKLIKTLKNTIITLGILAGIYTIVSIQNILFGTIAKTKESYALVGAGFVDSTIKLWGYLIFSIILVVSITRAANQINTFNIKKVVKPLIIIPVYLIILFFVILAYNFIFVMPKELDVQNKYIEENIKLTRQSYDIQTQEDVLDYSGAITTEEANTYSEVIENIPIVSEKQVLTTLKDTQSDKGYYYYDNISLGQYNISGKETLTYVVPRKIKNTGRTYQNKTYEMTHGLGIVFVNATKTTDDGKIEYIQKSKDGSDNVINISKMQTYYSNDINNTVITNAKSKKEYDYTTQTGEDITSAYEGEGGLKLNELDRIILALKRMDLGIAFNGEITSDSRILINRNVIIRAKQAIPGLIYDNDPYAVIDEQGNIKYVLDAYTFSSDMPYSQYTMIEYKNKKQKINYIKNSIKVIIDSYTGEMKYYITDRTDPIAMTYNKLYPEIFADKDEQIPEDIQKHLIYPQYLYDIQANMLNVYHSTKTDIIYRADDVWEITKTGSNKNSASLEPIQTILSPANDGTYMGLVQLYSPQDKRNIISYLVGNLNGQKNELKIYEFNQDANVIGPYLLDNQLNEDEQISKELETLNKTGSKLTSKFIAVPLKNTMLYVKVIYQTQLNENDAPVLKKIIVSSGNKVAIGDNLQEAIYNLLSINASSLNVIDLENTQDLINSIINANNNLKQSANNNNYELFGKDLAKLQDLINKLEQVQKEDVKKQEELKKEQDKEQETIESIEESIEQSAE